MFNFFKKKSQIGSPEIRDVLFGDLPFSCWPPSSPAESPEVEPWLSFIRAKQQKDAGNLAEAVRLLQGILSQADLESRHTLQAWHFLRELGIQPTDEAKQVYGVVVEVALPKGLDILAAYADHTARYFNYSGAAVIWERPDESLDASIDALLHSGQEVASRIGPWEKTRPAAPHRGEVRINMLTPSGLHFGQAKQDLLAKDAKGGPVISHAMTLMQQLMAKTNRD